MQLNWTRIQSDRINIICCVIQHGGTNVIMRTYRVYEDQESFWGPTEFMRTYRVYEDQQSLWGPTEFMRTKRVYEDLQSLWGPAEFMRTKRVYEDQKNEWGTRGQPGCGDEENAIRWQLYYIIERSWWELQLTEYVVECKYCVLFI